MLVAAYRFLVLANGAVRGGDSLLIFSSPNLSEFEAFNCLQWPSGTRYPQTSSPIDLQIDVRVRKLPPLEVRFRLAAERVLERSEPAFPPLRNPALAAFRGAGGRGADDRSGVFDGWGDEGARGWGDSFSRSVLADTAGAKKVINGGPW